jgi:hypothetical protein
MTRLAFKTSVSLGFACMSSQAMSHMTKEHLCDRTPLKKQGFVSQDPTGGLSMK